MPETMEMIEIGIVLCLGSLVALAMGTVALELIDRIAHRRYIRRLGDAWLESVIQSYDVNNHGEMDDAQ